MKLKLQILNLEDSETDTKLIQARLEEDEIASEIIRVETEVDFVAALDKASFDLLLVDYKLPSFDGMSALAIARVRCPDIPFIFVSGYIGEDIAIEALKNGATDYILKNNLARLPAAVRRALREAEERVERKRAEDALRKSEAKYRLLHESMRDAFVSVDMQGRITEFNKAYQSMLGYSPAELLKLTYVDLTPEKWHAFEQKIVGEQVIPRGYSDVYEKEYRKKDGTVFPVELRTFLIRDAAGNPAAMWAIVRDITERKKSDELLRGILESIDEGFIVIDRDYRIITANRAFTQKTGMLLKHVIGEHCYEISHHCDAPCYEAGHMCAVVQVFETGMPHTVIHTHVDEEGKPLYVETKAYPLSRDESGKVMTVIEILVDITAREKVEEALRKSEARYRHLFDNMLEGFAFCKMLYVEDAPQDFVYIHVNKAFEALTGLTNVIGKKVSQVIPGIQESNPELLRYYGRVALTGNSERFETYVESLGIWFSIAAYSMEKEHFVAVFDNITLRKRAEEALSASERQYRQLVDNALVGVYRSVPEGKFLYVNDALASMFECENADEMLRLPVEIRYKKPEDRKAFLKLLREQGKVPYYETEVLTRTGKLKTLVISAILEDGFITGMVTDITESKHLEAQLRHAQKMEAVGTLAGGIAHDFNNILNVIIGYGAMVLDNLEAESPSKGLMNEVLAAAERAANLTKRLLAFSRKQLTEMRPINVNETIMDIQKMLVRTIGEDIDFQLDLKDGSLVVMADAGQIEQVLINLAANARDAMPKGGRLTIGTSLQEIDDEYIAVNGYGTPGTYAIITVVDTGKGMDAETQKKIFEPFFTTKGIGEGTGLGLAISYGIIKQHNGYIKAYSKPGQGTVFKIYLPLVEDAASLEEKIEAPDAVKGGNETVLVAEDDASMRKLTRIVLESFGYTVITAEDGEDAITKFMENRERIDLAVLDMIMPKKNGKEVGEALKKASPGIKILFVSGYTMEIIKNKELTEYGFDFIHKPVRPQELLRKVREVLDKA